MTQLIRSTRSLDLYPNRSPAEIAFKDRRRPLLSQSLLFTGPDTQWPNSPLTTPCFNFFSSSSCSADSAAPGWEDHQQSMGNNIKTGDFAHIITEFFSHYCNFNINPFFLLSLVCLFHWLWRSRRYKGSLISPLHSPQSLHANWVRIKVVEWVILVSVQIIDFRANWMHIKVRWVVGFWSCRIDCFQRKTAFILLWLSPPSYTVVVNKETDTLVISNCVMLLCIWG